jgi:dihydrofolate synthase/folylpolyglutamate synthase
MHLNLKKYNDTVNYLYSLQKHGIKLGLTNTKRLMGILGEPHKSFHSIHVAGTNGKGSTASVISSILIANGFKVGLFTSPHLVSFTERIRINDRCVIESDVIDLAFKIREHITDTDINPTFFEFVTAMAFYHFAINNVEWAIVETGMGGRLDATNVIWPDVTIITNVSHDHCEFLGDNISDITYEKAGIMKNDVPVITASRTPDVIKQLTDIANSRDAEIHIYDRDFSGSFLQMDDRHVTLDYNGYKKYKNLTAPLSGEYQLYNICMAIRACEILRQKSFHISDMSVRAGLENLRLEGRLEWVSHTPPIIIDSAHNPEASKSLAISIRKLFPDKKIILIAGVMNDKDIRGILYPLIQIAETVILTKARYERAASPERLGSIITDIQESGINCSPASIISTNNVADALDLAGTRCKKDNIIIASGSFYTTGEVKEVLGHTAVLSRLRE